MGSGTLLGIVTLCATLFVSGPARAADETVADTGQSTVRSSVAADRVTITVAAAPGGKLSGEFGVTVQSGEDDRTIWLVPFPYTVIASTPYFKEAVAISLPFRQRKGRTSILVEYGVCTEDGTCIPESVRLSF